MPSILAVQESTSVECCDGHRDQYPNFKAGHGPRCNQRQARVPPLAREEMRFMQVTLTEAGTEYVANNWGKEAVDMEIMQS